MQAKGGRRIATFAAVLAGFAALAFVPAGAGAVTFGTNLGQPATNTTTCGAGIPPLFFTGIGSPSCMYFSSAPGPTPYAPGTGTVTAVRVRVGNVTGPMQVVVMRSLYQNHAGDPGHPFFACCFVQSYGPIFTPQPNAVTEVPTNLPVTEEPTPPPEDTTTNAAGDFLALSVLASNVPIPMSIDNQTLDTGFYPAPTAGTVPAPSPNPLFGASFSAGQVLLNAEFNAGGGGGGGGGAVVPVAPTLRTAPIPAVTLPRLTIPVNGNIATFPIQCLVADCSGLLNLQNAQQAGLARAAGKKRSKKPRIVSYGSVKFSLKAGKTGKVKVKLNAAGRKLFSRRHKQAKVWANVRFSSGGGRPKSTRVTLKHS